MAVDDCKDTLMWCAKLIAGRLAEYMKGGDTETVAMYKILKDSILNIPAFIRVVFSYPMYMDIVDVYLDEAQDYFRTSPSAATYMATICPLLNDVMKLTSSKDKNGSN